MIDTPTIVISPAVLTAHIPLVVPRTRIQEVMGPGITEIFGVLATQGIKPAGAWFTHHRRRPNETFDFSICVPVGSPVKPSGRVLAGSLPAATVARTIYHGAYEGLGDAWCGFLEWVAKHNHTPRADLWECYMQGPESGADPTKWRTELNQPLVKT